MTAMREMYESACHPEPTPPRSSLGMLGGDPFYDRNPWFRLIGRYVEGGGVKGGREEKRRRNELPCSVALPLAVASSSHSVLIEYLFSL